MSKQKHHQLRSEPQQNEITEVRGLLVGALTEEARPPFYDALPKRFKMQPSIDTPSMWFEDTLTGKLVSIGLCDAHGARKVLCAFFPDLE